MKSQNAPLIGPCPVCGRDMFDDGSCNKHHFIPKSEGGSESEHVHRACHEFIHKQWTEKELASQYSDPQKLREDPRVQAFARFMRKHDPSRIAKTKRARRKGRR